MCTQFAVHSSFIHSRDTESVPELSEMLCHVQQTCYNRCVSNNEPVTSATSADIHIHSSPSSTLIMTTESTNTNLTQQALPAATDTAGITTITDELMSMKPVTKSCRIPLSYVSAFTLSVLWHVVYWTSQVLTWFALQSQLLSLQFCELHLKYVYVVLAR